MILREGPIMLNIHSVRPQPAAPPRFGLTYRDYNLVHDLADTQHTMAGDVVAMKVDKFSSSPPIQRLSDMLLGMSLSSSVRSVALLNAAELPGLQPQDIFHIAAAVAHGGK